MPVKAMLYRYGRISCKGMTEVIVLHQVIPQGRIEVVFHHKQFLLNLYVTDYKIG